MEDLQAWRVLGECNLRRSGCIEPRPVGAGNTWAQVSAPSPRVAPSSPPQRELVHAPPLGLPVPRLRGPAGREPSRTRASGSVVRKTIACLCSNCVQPRATTRSGVRSCGNGELRSRQMARPTAPLLRLRSKERALNDGRKELRPGYWKRTASLTGETVARGMKLSCGQSRQFLPSRDGHLGQLSKYVSM